MTTKHDRWVADVTNLAREYRKLMSDGNVVLAEQVRRTIDDHYAGTYVDGRWTLHDWVRREMGES